MAKIGPSSGHTAGVVIKRQLVNAQIDFPHPHRGTTFLGDAFLVRSDHGHFATPGDSGSPVFRESDGTLIGMVIAATRGNRYGRATAVMHIGDVLRALNMDFAA